MEIITVKSRQHCPPLSRAVTSAPGRQATRAVTSAPAAAAPSNTDNMPTDSCSTCYYNPKLSG
eukprot:scaffold424192_cov13-Prasinocladus_malaysianus.AAC.1